MKVFIDFDDVIFNTGEFKRDFRNMFIQQGIPAEVFDRCYVNPQDTRAIKTFDPWMQAEGICHEMKNLNHEHIKKSVKDFIQDISRYVFFDVSDFIDSIGAKNISIISFGEKEFQTEKIKNSHVGQFIPNVFITEDSKSELIGEILEKDQTKEKVFFLDDRVEQINEVKKNFPEIITFLMKRPEGRYQNQLPTSFADFEVADLNEAREIINSI